jgi:cathepsin F
MSDNNSSSMTKRAFILALLLGISAMGALYLTSTPQKISLFQTHLYGEADLEDIEKEYINFIAKYQKSFGSKSETLSRFQVFKDNYRAIKAHNSLGEAAPFTMEINKFADMSNKEFEDKYIG